MATEKIKATDDKELGKTAAGTTKRGKKTAGKKSASKAKEAANIEEEKKKFQEKLIALKELAKSKKNVLELSEINNLLKDVELTEEKTEKV